MKILLFGKNGQVGWELNRSLQPLGEVTALGRDDADFSKAESLRQIVQDVRPDVIVNAVAYTAVDKAEEEEGLAAKVNSIAPGVLA
ncbi:MAG: NAD(P)-dependent oxidoreductase, partial [Gammaproteobacteria bacterium]